MLNDNIKLLIEQSGISDKLLGNIVQVKDEKLDSVTIKTNPKCIYTISKDIILKQCTKCKNFKDLKSFAGFGNGSTCMFKLDYRCKVCSKRSKEKEIEYYHKKMVKKNPNYIPLAQRPVKVKEVKTKRKYNKKNKIVENLAATNLTEVDFVDKTLVYEPVEEIKIVEVYPLENKVEEEDLVVIEQIVDKIEEAVEPETPIPVVKKKRVYKKKVKPPVDIDIDNWDNGRQSPLTNVGMINLPEHIDRTKPIFIPFDTLVPVNLNVSSSVNQQTETLHLQDNNEISSSLKLHVQKPSKRSSKRSTKPK